MKTEVVLFMNELGRLQGIDPAQDRAYGAFKRKTKTMEPGETMLFAWEDPRSRTTRGSFSTSCASS